MVQLDEKWMLQNLPRRKGDSHKGTYGTLSILGGSTQYRGAPLLAASGALRAGAGIVRIVSIEAVCAAAAASLPGCVLQPVAEEESGRMGPQALGPLLAAKPSAILAGPGLDNTAGTAALVEGVLQKAACPLVLDADGLNVLAGHLATGEAPDVRARLFAALDKPDRILTPHIGEMARLVGKSAAEVAENQRGEAMALAAKTGCVVVLKSYETVVAAPSGDEFMAGCPNPGLAKGGSGDVLAGIIASLAAQGLRGIIAAAAGVWLHTEAARLLARTKSQTGMLPAELPNALCEVWKRLEELQAQPD